MARIRTLTLASAAGRALIGVGMLAAPNRTLPAMGFADPSPGTVAVARLAGVRDLVFAAQLVPAIGNPQALRRTHPAAAASDAGDALVFAAAARRGDPTLQQAAKRGFAASLPAAIGGLWLAFRSRG